MFKLKRFFAVGIAAVTIFTGTMLASTRVALAKYQPDFPVTANAVYFVNLDTDTVMYEKNANERIYPASTTKIMTAILTMEMGVDLDNTKISLKPYVQDAMYVKNRELGGISLAGIRMGDEYSLRELLYAAMLPSGNEAAMMLGDYVGDGSMDYFAELMNKKAKELGADNTHFVNSNGLHDPDHYTTAYDMYLITKHAMGIDGFMDIAGSKYFYGGNKSGEEMHWNTTNKMMVSGNENYYPYIKGIKTGTTNEAGRCIISTATKNSNNYLLVLMGAPYKDAEGKIIPENQSFIQTKAIYEWAFNSFKSKTLIEKGKGVGEVPLKLAAGGKDYLLLMSGDIFTDLLPNEIQPSSITLELELPKAVAAPVKRGAEIGTIKLMLAGQEVGRVPAVAAESVDASPVAVVLNQLFSIFDSFFAKVAVIFTVLSIIAYVIIMSLRNKNSSRRRRR